MSTVHYNNNNVKSNLTINAGQQCHHSRGSSVGMEVASVFFSSAMNIGEMYMYSLLSGAAGGSTKADTAALGNLATTLQTYVTADAALDKAKQDMNNAVDALDGLEADLEEAKKAKDGGATEAQSAADKFKDYKNLTSPEDQAKVKAYQEALEKYQTNKKNFEAYNNLKTEQSNISTVGLDVTSGKAKIDENFGAKSVTKSNGEAIPLKCDGNAEASINTNNFMITLKEGESPQLDKSTYENAKRIAKQLDTDYAERMSRLTKYNELQAKIESHPGKDVKQADLVAPDPNDENYKVSNTNYGTAAKYLQEKKDAENKASHLKTVGTDESIKAIEAKIEAKKKEIKGSLTEKLTSAQQTFDSAKAAVDAIQADVMKNTAQESTLAQAKEAKGSKTSKDQRGSFLGIFKKHNSVQDKNYRTAKKEYKQGNAQFAQAYGANAASVQNMIEHANAKVNAVDVNLKNYKDV